MRNRKKTTAAILLIALVITMFTGCKSDIWENDMMRIENSLNEYGKIEELREVSRYFIGGRQFIPFAMTGMNLKLACSVASWDYDCAMIGLEHLRHVFTTHGDQQLIHHVYADCSDDSEKEDVVLIHLPSDNPDPAKPGILMCAGGGFLFVSSITASFPVAKSFNEAGYDVWVLNYRVGGIDLMKETNPKPLDDLANAVSLMRSLTGDRDYAVLGFSAGGYMASAWGTTGNGYLKYGLPAPKALVLLFPITNLNDLGNGIASKVEMVKIAGFGASDEKINSLNVVGNVSASYPPSFIVVCRDDKTVPYTNSTLLKKQLDDAGVRADILVGNRGGHGFALGNRTDIPDWTTRAQSFLQSLR